MKYLSIKPVFERLGAGKFAVQNYDLNKGELKIDGTKYIGGQRSTYQT